MLDLDRACDFYVGLLGLIETERTECHLYLRCTEDYKHHSLVLTKGAHHGLGHIAFRVGELGDIERLGEAYGDRAIVVAACAERAQGEALRLQDPFGFPVEFYHRMERVERRTRTPGEARPIRLDHVNLRVAGSVDDAVRYYCDRLGFMVSEYAVNPDGSTYRAWIHRKQTTHDVAVGAGAQPLIHHTALYVPETKDVLRIADAVAGAGLQSQLEFGPGRHGATNAFFLYLFDPDGNRLEIYSGDYLIPDPDFEPIRWTREEFERTGRLVWGGRPPASFDDGQPIADWTTPPPTGPS